jgi:hypothetical protein
MAFTNQKKHIQKMQAQTKSTYKKCKHKPKAHTKNASTNQKCIQIWMGRGKYKEIQNLIKT